MSNMEHLCEPVLKENTRIRREWPLSVETLSDFIGQKKANVEALVPEATGNLLEGRAIHGTLVLKTHTLASTHSST